MDSPVQKKMKTYKLPNLKGDLKDYWVTVMKETKKEPKQKTKGTKKARVCAKLSTNHRFRIDFPYEIALIEAMK